MPHAADIWKLKYLEKLNDSSILSLTTIENGNENPPLKDSILIWNRGPEYPFGHVAVITEVDTKNSKVLIAEQNITNDYWPGNHSRELKLLFSNQKYWIKDRENPLGWIIINPANKTDTEIKTFERISSQLSKTQKNLFEWSTPAEEYFGKVRGQQLTKSNERTVSYYLFEKHFADKIKLATYELNHMCLVCTDLVLKNDSLLEQFGLPKWSWNKIRESWAMWQTSKLTVSGRFDIAAKGRTLKMIEFNADSAGTIFEAAVIQNKWAKACGVDIGTSAGEDIEEMLLRQLVNVYDNFVHIMIDTDPEEIMSALYIQQLLTKLGLGSKIIVGKDFYKENEKFYDDKGTEIKLIWKTWNWETLIDDFGKNIQNNEKKLSEIFFSPNITVIEPLWKVVTSNKALMNVLWDQFPKHPYLLRSEWELGEFFKNKPYVKKPIVGRCGENIEIVNENGAKIEAKNGQFSNRDFIYQEVFDIQQHNGFYPIIGSWVIGMHSAGFGIREDSKRITEYNSDYKSCRISDD